MKALMAYDDEDFHDSDAGSEAGFEDEDDLDLINENITHKKKKLKRDKIEDENEAEVNQGWLDADKHVSYDKR